MTKTAEQLLNEYANIAKYVIQLDRVVCLKERNYSGDCLLDDEFIDSARRLRNEFIKRLDTVRNDIQALEPSYSDHYLSAIYKGQYH